MNKSANSLSVLLPGNSGSKFVFFSDATRILKITASAPDSFNVGQRITAAGTLNTDGSIVAQNIQIEPQTQQAAGSATQQAAK